MQWSRYSCADAGVAGEERVASEATRDAKMCRPQQTLRMDAGFQMASVTNARTRHALPSRRKGTRRVSYNGDAEVAVTAVGLSQVVRLTLSRLPVGIPELDMISMLDVGVSSAQVDICDL